MSTVHDSWRRAFAPVMGSAAESVARQAEIESLETVSFDTEPSTPTGVGSLDIGGLKIPWFGVAAALGGLIILLGGRRR